MVFVTAEAAYTAIRRGGGSLWRRILVPLTGHFFSDAVAVVPRSLLGFLAVVSLFCLRCSFCGGIGRLAVVSLLVPFPFGLVTSSKQRPLC